MDSTPELLIYIGTAFIHFTAEDKVAHPGTYLFSNVNILLQNRV